MTDSINESSESRQLPVTVTLCISVNIYSRKPYISFCYSFLVLQSHNYHLVKAKIRTVIMVIKSFSVIITLRRRAHFISLSMEWIWSLLTSSLPDQERNYFEPWYNSIYSSRSSAHLTHRFSTFFHLQTKKQCHSLLVWTENFSALLCNWWKNKETILLKIIKNLIKQCSPQKYSFSSSCSLFLHFITFNFYILL